MKGKNIILAGMLILSTSLLTGCIMISFPKVTSSPSSSTVSSKTSSASVSAQPTSGTVSESLSASSSAAASESLSESTSVPSGTEQTLTGTFVRIEWGDYMHLYMTDDNMVEHTFFIKQYPGLDPESLVAGQKIKVTWMNVDEFISEAGGSFNFDKITKIELVS